MAMITMTMKLSALLLLLLRLAASLPVAPGEEPAPVKTAKASDSDEDVQSVETVNDSEMRDKMAYLILSFWDSDIQGLEGLDGLDGGPYLAVDDPPQALQVQSERRKRDIVFRPLWVTHQRHAARLRAQQRYWDQVKRSQRVRRDAHASQPGHQRARRAAPLSETELMEAIGQTPLSRVRRQWVFYPLFSTRTRQTRGRPRGRRQRRDVQEAADIQDAVEGEALLSRTRREWAIRPLFSSRQRTARRNQRRRYRETREVEAPVEDPGRPLSRPRREWVDVPLFAVKQIEAQRVKEEQEITHGHHHQPKDEGESRRPWNPYEYYEYYNNRYRG